MKITKRQLRRIIKEEKAKLLSESSGFSPDALKDMQQAIDFFRLERGDESDAASLENIQNMAVEELAAGAEYPSDELFDMARNLDTIVWDEVPHEISSWLESYDDEAY